MAWGARNLISTQTTDQVLVDLRRRRAEQGRELVLVRRDLAVARAERDAQAEALGLDLLHAG